MPWKGMPEGNRPQCRKCGNQLKQLPWVLAHSEGYLADVPWHWLAHGNAVTPEQKKCKMERKDADLTLLKKGRPDHYEIRCSVCRAKGEFYGGIRIPYGTQKVQPWRSEMADFAEGAGLAVVLDVNDARVHMPVSVNALVIPPESRIQGGTVLDLVYSNPEIRKSLESANRIKRANAVKDAAERLRCAPEEILDALDEIERGYPLYGKNVTVDDLLLSEYEALCEKIETFEEGEDFITRHWTEEWRKEGARFPEGSMASKLVQAVSHLVEVVRLKEIQVFRGFHRVDGEKVVPPNIKGKSSWLPAIELYGEGVFFAFEEEFLRKWEENVLVQRRAEGFKKRFKAANLSFHPEVVVSPRFLLLHVLSHLLIRQVEAESGYPAASLKERVYSSASRNMAGVLIYVAVPDESGSLGGLSELVRPEKFLRLLKSAFEHAEWCSLDPVCGEHDGHGPGLLNRAACHGCVLIPEPSCCCGNVLLDRCFIRGSQEEGGTDVALPPKNLPPFLDFVNADRRIREP
jgi:hypothetical protein